GLRSFGARWDSGQLALSTGDLDVWFRGISEPDDDGAGFRLHASHLGIGPGGVDLEMTVSGGSARLMGIGDSFKATHGSIRLVNSRLEAGAITAQGAL